MNVILLGASTRAAAMSARRAGWTPWCADLYADADLQRIATVCKIPLAAYPHGLLDALRNAPDAPVIYTGAMENWPGLLARIDRPLLGNPPDVLRAVRSPERWERCLREAGLPCPKWADGPVTGGQWLLKPRRSAGGLNIQDYHGQPFNPRSHFLQECIGGVPCSAVFLGAGDGAFLLGVTRQLIGAPWLNAGRFHYAGNLGPLLLDSATHLIWQRIGAALTQAFRLRGLFGVDAIERDSVPWPVEINPRYTASMEVLERASGQAFLPLHRAAFEPTSLPRLEPSAPAMIVGKAIQYALANFAFPEHGPWLASLEADANLDTLDYADIPIAGELIDQGQPVMTLFASAATVSDCETMLQEKADTLARRLWG